MRLSFPSSLCYSAKMFKVYIIAKKKTRGQSRKDRCNQLNNFQISQSVNLKNLKIDQYIISYYIKTTNIRMDGSLFKCVLLNLARHERDVSKIADRARLDVSR